MRRSCGLHRPCTQTDVAGSPGNQPIQGPQPHRAECVVTVHRLSVLGGCFFSLHCFALEARTWDEKRGWALKGQIIRRLVVGCFDRRAVILRFCSSAAACGSSSRLTSGFGCFSEFQPGMCCSTDKRAVHQTTAELQINSLKISRFIVPSQSNFPTLAEMWQQ